MLKNMIWNQKTIPRLSISVSMLIFRTLDDSEHLSEKLKQAWDAELEKNPKNPKLWKAAVIFLHSF
jgi:hypothetical protein